VRKLRNPQPNLLLYSLYHAEACSEQRSLSVQYDTSLGNKGICIDVEAVESCLQHCGKLTGLKSEFQKFHTRYTRVNSLGHGGGEFQFYRLFANLPRPGESEIHFRSSIQAATCYYNINGEKNQATDKIC